MKRLDERGVGLIELMIAIAITSVIVLATYKTFFGSQREAFRVTALVERRQNSRSAVQLMERDIRMAGSGWGKMRVSGCWNGAQLSIYALMWRDGGTKSDTIGILGGWDRMTTLTAKMTTKNTAITVADPTGFATGDLVVVTNANLPGIPTAHLFQLTGVAGSDLQHSTASLYNVNGGHAAFPGSGYATGSQVYKASWVSYRVDTTTYRKPSLVRWENGRPAQLVAFDVTSFKVNYLLQDGTTTNNPGVDSVGINLIDQVMPVVRTLASTSQMKSVADSFWTSVQPRTF
jgi:prepilin-type N-terminal cleavage/methylation domain-containing protein